jgi:hypothetical protein
LPRIGPSSAATTLRVIARLRRSLTADTVSTMRKGTP